MPLVITSEKVSVSHHIKNSGFEVADTKGIVREARGNWDTQMSEEECQFIRENYAKLKKRI